MNKYQKKRHAEVRRLLVHMEIERSHAFYHAIYRVFRRMLQSIKSTNEYAKKAHEKKGVPLGTLKVELVSPRQVLVVLVGPQDEGIVLKSFKMN